MGDVQLTRTIHSNIGIKNNVYISNALLSSYSKCRSIFEAHLIFSRMPQHSIVSWNTFLMTLVESNEFEYAICCFENMPCDPDPRSFVAALSACSHLANKGSKPQWLEKGKAIHELVMKTGSLSDIYVRNSLVNMYTKCSSMFDARNVFDTMNVRDTITWNTLILGYGSNGEAESALSIFQKMECEPDARTYVAVLMACLSLVEKEELKEVGGKLVKIVSLEKAMELHARAFKGGFGCHLCMTSILLDLYAKCGSLLDARLVFDTMPLHDVVSWTALIMACVDNGEPRLALKLYECMKLRCEQNERTFVVGLVACSILATNEPSSKTECLEKGREIHYEASRSGCDHSDVFVASALVEMYAKCGSMHEARNVFEITPRLSRDVIPWTSLILGYTENGEPAVALQLFERMQSVGCAPDAQTFVAVLVTCGELGSLEIGRHIHTMIRENHLEENVFIANSLMDFYGKCGRMDEARQVFDRLPQGKRNTVSWSSLMSAYARHGDTERVFQLFEKMKEDGVKPNRVTFLAILTVCSHAGLVEKCEEYFDIMESVYGITRDIEHYHCMVDMYGRANLLEGAVSMVENMPFEPNMVTWKTVLGACAKWKNVEVGRFAFERLVEIDPTEENAYVVMGNIYKSVGLLDDHAKILKLRRA